MATKYDILITGSLVSTDLIMAEHLARLGLTPLVVRRTSQSAKIQVPEDYLCSFPAENLIINDSPWHFLKLARSSKLLFSLTGSLVTHLRELWPLRNLIGLPPIVNLTTGSDITELAVSEAGLWDFSKSNLKKILYRQYLRSVDLNWCLPLPHALRNIQALKLKNVVFMRGFPYMMPQVSKEESSLPHGDIIRFFHCSHLDWNYTNFSPIRNSTKGNDKFLRAFIRAAKQGYPVHLTILDRGADREIAQEMIKRGGVQQQVEWLSHLDRAALFQQMNAADIVVNMFGHGGAGSISFEALALGRPVMQYANPTFFNLMYGGNIPPFLNARTEEEIYEKIIWACETGDLDRVANEGKQWVTEYLTPEQALQQFLFYYSLLTGEQALDFGAFIDEAAQHASSVEGKRYNPYESSGS